MFYDLISKTFVFYYWIRIIDDRNGNLQITYKACYMNNIKFPILALPML